MQDKKIILIGGVDLIRGRIRGGAGPAMVEVCDELEPLLRESGYAKSAPFRTVSLILRFGTRRNLEVDYQPINKRHSELPVAVELEMSIVSRMSRDELKHEFMIATLSVLLDVAERYGLPSEVLAERYTRLTEHKDSSKTSTDSP